jgi:hypothetical protein
MLNQKIADTPLFCGCDVDNIISFSQLSISTFMEKNDKNILSANEIGSIILENIELNIIWKLNKCRKCGN